MAQKPSIPKGTRDFSPVYLAKRNYIISIIKKHFEVFGFQPIETPSFENSETLLGKYGEEGDRLIFKILNSGDYLSKVEETTYALKNSVKLTPEIAEKALRYDLTVPFARYVVMYQNDIDFPFKRYQIQPVWRADRPQRGRFREFYQCDADVVGANTLLQEVEFIQLYNAVFSELGLEGCTIKMNNRKILAGIAEVIGAAELLVDFTVALDKLDKIGEDKVKDEMAAKGISAGAIEKASPLFHMRGEAHEQLSQLKVILAESTMGLQGVAELETILNLVEVVGLKASSLQLDVTLARGLNYYTGAIFEVSAPKGIPMGSIGGGGRYDNLTGIFGLKDVSGVGISFGLDRIYLVLEALDLFPDKVLEGVQVLVLNFGQDEAVEELKLTSRLRQQGLKVDLYPSSTKMQKQFRYADKRQIPFVVLMGANEIEKGEFIVKNMKTGAQETFPLDGINAFLQYVNESNG